MHDAVENRAYRELFAKIYRNQLITYLITMNYKMVRKGYALKGMVGILMEYKLYHMSFRTMLVDNLLINSES